MTQAERLTAVDLFSGAGGTGIGFIEAGYQILAALDNEPNAAKTYRLNLGIDVLEADIREVNPAWLRKELGLTRRQLGVLAGCPPCQGFSRIRNNAGATDERNALVLTYLSFVDRADPSASYCSRRLRSVNQIEGRILIGLDEFMLRLGHLTALIDTAEELGGIRNRVVRAFAQWLTEPLPVPDSLRKNVGEYLVKKQLAQVRRGSETTEPKHKSRYAHLLVTMSNEGEIGDLSVVGQGPFEIWREDLLIAHPSVRSKVGAVTIETRHTSNKTGVSHLVDWALSLGVLDNNLNAGSIGSVLRLLSLEEKKRGNSNPYDVQGQRLGYLWALFQADGDVLRALLTGFPADRSLTKATALTIFESVFTQIYDSAFGAGSEASAAATRRVREMRDDLGIAGGSVLGRARASTMWHRLSSRLESLVDLGLLDKVDDRGNRAPFEYVYRLTPSGKRAATSLAGAVTIEDWLLEYASRTVAESQAAPLSDLERAQYLIDAIARLRGPTGVHVDSCALLAASLAALDKFIVEIGEMRTMIVDTALRRPELARLARGHAGTRPEFVAFDSKEFARIVPEAFLAVPSSSSHASLI